MAKTATVTISLAITGDGMNLAYTAPVMSNVASPGEQQPLALSSGNNAISVPAGALGILIVPPAGSTVAKTLKGVNGDTGQALGTAAATFLALPSGATSLVLNAAAPETVSLYWI